MFGLYAASLLSSKGARVALLEKEKTIFDRASKINQARIHRGYHYPRSFETAKKTSNYYDRFCNDFNFSLIKPFKEYYAISREKSKVSTDDYIKFCKKLNIPLKEADSSLYFKQGKVDSTFEVEESCFDHLKIKNYFLNKFTNNNNVDIYCETFPISQKISNSKYVLSLNNTLIKLVAPIVINTTYSNINNVNKMFGFSGYGIKYELCELALCTTNNGFSNIGLIVVDGPFFSLMPFAEGNISSLSSVRFTPIKTGHFKPQDINSRIKQHSNWKKMKSLAQGYLREGAGFEYKSSIFEIKPILISSEKDDSRPTLATVHSKDPFFISILSGKINTIYDLDETLDKVI